MCPVVPAGQATFTPRPLGRIIALSHGSDTYNLVTLRPGSKLMVVHRHRAWRVQHEPL